MRKMRRMKRERRVAKEEEAHDESGPLPLNHQIN